MEVDTNFTDDELRGNYKQLALILHPDKNFAPQSHEAFEGYDFKNV